MRFTFHSIRNKLVSIVMLTTLVALLVSLGAIVAYDLRSYHNNLVTDMTTQAELLGHMTAPALTFDDKQLATENLNLFRIRKTVRAAAIYNARGDLFATYKASGDVMPFPDLPNVDTIRTEGSNLLIFKRIVSDGATLGTVYLCSDYDLVRRTFDYIGVAAIVTLGVLAVVFLLISNLEKFVTQPVYAISKIAHDVVEQRDYSRRAEKVSDDEVGMLVDSFNDMLAEIERRTKDLETSNQEIAREVEKRSRAQNEVMRLNTDLENRVRERTMQLEATNEELAQAKANAEKANQAKSAFLSSMSHELRTPLNAILGFGQILASETLPSTPVQKKEFIGHILKAGRHLLTLINEVLDLAKVESGAMVLSLEPVCITTILRECHTMIEPMAKQRNIRLAFPTESNLHVIADRTRLKQVLLNLLSNAIKYNREAGAVTISCDAINAEHIRISVQDTGDGLHQEQVNALFQPFNRLGQEAGTEEGTGIGLVVTKRLVELMGGTIGVNSTFGVGSMFWIDLKATVPIAAPSANNIKSLPDKAKAEASDTNHLVMLYIEDNPANLRLVEELVRFRSDLHLLAASDAHLGIELARTHLPDLILMDINLPGMSGDDARKVLQTHPKTAQIPIIAVTANAMPRDIQKGLEAGFFRYITKPINIDEFNEAIDSALGLVGARLKQIKSDH
ncbi:MAG TPA: ATP-binding protein [Burkholderiaceae bacterium]|jgi:signal transduction histidine kinase/CheY-like chemotaxis protein/HAMP domain-containing protein